MTVSSSENTSWAAAVDPRWNQLVHGEGRHMDTAFESTLGHARFSVGTRVEVHTRYELGRWAPGFTIAEVLADGYRIRRTSDGAVLDDTIRPDEIRLASPVPTRSYHDELLAIVHSGDQSSGYGQLRNRDGPMTSTPPSTTPITSNQEYRSLTGPHPEIRS
jgi:hypothetical protein